MVKTSKWQNMFQVGNIFRVEGSSRKADVAETSGWNLGVLDVMEKPFCNLYTCYHPGEVHILTTTDPYRDMHVSAYYIDGL